MSSVLNEICSVKKDHVTRMKSVTPLAEIKARLADIPKPKPRFINTLKNAPHTAIIAEVKKASPSKGIIRDDFCPKTIAKTYTDHGATCISVLTDTPYFQGQDVYLEQVKSVTDTPVLRKDFMVDTYQFYEAAVMGADCVLLIMAALSDEQARDFYELSYDLGMDVLVEIHNEQELERALMFAPKMIGVNNRNLKTLKVDVQTSFDILPLIPDGTVKISESGLVGRKTLQSLESSGYDGFLIGESLMRQQDIGAGLRALIG